MGEIRFPRRREDGTFRVLALYRTSDPSIRESVRAYVDAWTRANQLWVRVWRSDTIKEERLELASEFASDPHVEMLEAGGFAIVFDGLASSTRWKDWAVRLTDDVLSIFPEVRFEKFES